MTRIIRTLALPEIATLLDWAAAEGWNPGLNDAVAFQAADPSGFFGAFVDGVMVAGIAAVAYDAAFGFIGLYICHPDWRGQGHGKAVWDAGMAYLGERTIGLDGVPEQQANYVAMGFVPAYETIRMSGTLASDQASARQIPPATWTASVFPPAAMTFSGPGWRHLTRAWFIGETASWMATPCYVHAAAAPRSVRCLHAT
jgi:GNAT superfamily N-acetyltransferase